MPQYPSFTEKLRLGARYPNAPVAVPGPESYPLYDRFLQDQQQGMPRYRGGIPDQPQLSGNPELTPKMQYQMAPSISENLRATATANMIHDGNLPQRGDITQYQRAVLRQKEAELGVKAQLGQGNLDVRNRSTNIADFKAKNPNHKFIQGKDGILRAVDPQTNEVTDLGSTGMTEQAIAALNQSNKIGQIDAQGRNALGLEDRRQEGRVVLQDDAQESRASLQDDAQQGRVDFQRSKPILPNQERVAKLTRAEKVRNEHPEWAKYIKTAPGGGFIVKGPSMGGLLGPSPETHKAIMDLINAEPDPIRQISDLNLSGGAPPVKPEIDPVTKKPVVKSKYQVTVR